MLKYSASHPLLPNCSIAVKPSSPWKENAIVVAEGLQNVVIIYRTILHQYTHLCKTPNILKIYTTRTKIQAEVQLLHLLVQPYLLPSRQTPPNLRWNRIFLVKSKVRSLRACPRCDIVMLATNSAPRIFSIPLFERCESCTVLPMRTIGLLQLFLRPDRCFGIRKSSGVAGMGQLRRR